MIVAMAGFPGTGKSTLARRLAADLGGTVIDKDQVRHALFGESFTEYTAEQDDFVLRLMLAAAERLVVQQKCPAVFIDGRTFSKAYQLDLVRETAAKLGCPMRIVECVCDPEIALSRIRADQHLHPARNRDAALYWRVRESFEPIPEPKFVADTGTGFDATTLAQRLVAE